MHIAVNGRNYRGRGTGTSDDPLVAQPEVGILSFPANGTFADRARATSATTNPITLVQVMPANANRNYLFVQNLSTTSTISLYYGSTKFMELEPRAIREKWIGSGGWCDADKGIIQASSADASVPLLAHEA